MKPKTTNDEILAYVASRLNPPSSNDIKLHVCEIVVTSREQVSKNIDGLCRTGRLEKTSDPDRPGIAVYKIPGTATVVPAPDKPQLVKTETAGGVQSDTDKFKHGGFISPPLGFERIQPDEFAIALSRLNDSFKSLAARLKLINAATPAMLEALEFAITVARAAGNNTYHTELTQLLAALKP